MKLLRIVIVLLAAFCLLAGIMFSQEQKKSAPKDDPQAPVLDANYRAEMLELFSSILQNDAQVQNIKKQYDDAMHADPNYVKLSNENADKINKLKDMANAKKVTQDGKTWIVNPTTAKYEPEPPKNNNSIAQPVTPPAESPK
jgi:hypothetical protein